MGAVDTFGACQGVISGACAAAVPLQPASESNSKTARQADNPNLSDGFIHFVFMGHL
jgi:hypothetical protein